VLVDPEMGVLKGGYGEGGVVEGIDPPMASFLALNFLSPQWLTIQLICINPPHPQTKNPEIPTGA